MKVMSCNTLLGGFDGTDDRHFLAHKEVVEAVNLDVLLVQKTKQLEANGYRCFYPVALSRC